MHCLDPAYCSRRYKQARRTAQASGSGGGGGDRVAPGTAWSTQASHAPPSPLHTCFASQPVLRRPWVALPSGAAPRRPATHPAPSSLLQHAVLDAWRDAERVATAAAELQAGRLAIQPAGAPNLHMAGCCEGLAGHGFHPGQRALCAWGGGEPPAATLAAAAAPDFCLLLRLLQPLPLFLCCWCYIPACQNQIAAQTSRSQSDSDPESDVTECIGSRKYRGGSGSGESSTRLGIPPSVPAATQAAHGGGSAETTANSCQQAGRGGAPRGGN